MDRNEVIKIKISQNDIFYFSRKYDKEKIHPLLIKTQSLYSTIADLPILPILYSQLEEELIRRSIHGTAALEGNPLSEERVGEIISAPEKIKSNQRAENEILNLKIAYDYIKNMEKKAEYLPFDEELIKLAQRNANNIACGHCFIIFLGNAFPVNILNTIKMVPEVVRIFCATANDVEVLVAETTSGRGIIGVIDGVPVKGIEGEEDIKERKEFLRKIGYKF